jgi:AraC-like DNA-binding protein/mannose-6-phosphate isomerase-like protein (cupin superfamily)
MKVQFEIVKADEESSYRLLHQKANEKDFLWEYHYHPEVEIACVLTGTGTRHVGNHISNYDDGDLVLIGANLPHSGFGLNASSPHEEIVVQIKEEVVFRNMPDLPEFSEIEKLLERGKYGIAFTGQTKADATVLMKQFLTARPFEKYVLLLQLLEMLAQSRSYYLLNKQIVPSTIITKHKARLQKIFSYVEKHYAENIEIGKMAALAALSVPSFCNYFKRTANITFTEFVNQYRIQKACLLLQQDKTIAEVCFDCGFNNVTYFNKVFKTLLKKTPSEYRKER